MTAPIATLRGPARLRELLKDPNKIIVAPGVYDGISARVALATGFDALYMVSIPGTIHAVISHP
jgi:2-methylisocitrate lyase-like PEP mutase family enzyme